MKTDFYIDKNRVLTTAQDYDLLREEGQRHIEDLSHQLWTDFNAHDPGITILEVLCYAITELGYRANFNIEDLLADKEGTIQNETFFKAEEILSNAPLTNLDYRKLLIDIEGINNAWILSGKNEIDALEYQLPLANEIPIYVNKKEDKLSLSSFDKFGNSLKRLPVRGLNKVIVELSEDIALGQLNRVSMEHSWLQSDRFLEVLITTEFSNWNHPKSQWLSILSNPVNIKIDAINIDNDKVRISIKNKLDLSQDLSLLISSVDPSEVALVKDYFNSPETISEALKQLHQKKEKVMMIYDQVNKAINENRNLTEDWRCIETVTDLELGICADIELETDADAEEILAKVQYTIDQILNPAIRFYTLNEMLDKALAPRAIFNGPTLTHGFLIDEEVQNSQLPDCIHASDIIAGLMDIEGITAVNNVLLTAYDDDGKPIDSAKNKKWCLHLNGEQRPVMDFNRSKLLLFRDGIPFIIPEKGAFELSQGVFYLKTENNSYKLQDPETDFPFPKGTHYQLDHYYSIQNDFPTTYGIGKGQLLESTPALRKAQSKQLKAYLLHFDQLLADFFKQLYHAKELLDIKPIANTYFHQYLTKIYGVDKNYFWNETYDDLYTGTIKEYEDQSDEFIKEEIKGRSFYENDAIFHDRRNRFLDHLLARFGESFNDYVLMMYAVQNNANGSAEIIIQEEELIKDKQRFLSNYPEISYGRGRGINYLQNISVQPAYPWGIPERGGYAKRIAAALGINKTALDNIIDLVPKQTWQYETDLDTLSFSLLNLVPFSLEEKWELAQMLINNVSSYRVDTFTNSFIYFVNNNQKKIAKLNKAFRTPFEAHEYIPKLYQAINSHLENFYCLEHLLLRPFINDNLVDDDLLQVCLNDDCYSEANNDPYSFKATVVLPGWLARFRNRYFRRHAEKIIRKEAPAHVLIKICWVGRDDMTSFQEKYKAWIIAFKKLRLKYCDKTLSPATRKAYNKKLSALIAEIKELNTIYDEGTLHDCLESELSNPILLNNSSLGTLQNIQP